MYKFTMITFNRFRISLKPAVKYNQQLQWAKDLYSHGTLCCPQPEVRLHCCAWWQVMTHLISITSLLLSSYFSFHSDTSLSLATIWNKEKEKWEEVIHWGGNKISVQYGYQILIDTGTVSKGTMGSNTSMPVDLQTVRCNFKKFRCEIMIT